MDNSFFRFKNFTTKKEFEKLKAFFKQNDTDYYNPNVSNEFDKENPKIIFRDFFYVDNDPEMFQESLVEQYFIKDFIIPGISGISTNEVLFLKKKCFDKSLFTKQLKEGYALDFKEKLLGIEQKITNANHLSDELRLQIKKQIKLTKSEIRRYIHNPYPKLNRKVNVKLQRNEVVALFHLLIQDGKIKNTTKADIGRIIDNSFKFFDDKEKKFCDIVDSRKDFVDFEKGNGDKTPIEAIKKIFTSNDFYNV
jgi:hypothetical protein